MPANLATVDSGEPFLNADAGCLAALERVDLSLKLIYAGADT